MSGLYGDRGGIENEENWFSFPGKFALKLVPFSRKKIPKSGLIFHLQHGGKKCSITVQFSTRLPDLIKQVRKIVMKRTYLKL